MDLWKLLLQIIKLKKHEVTFHKVKGHADNPWNNRCDELATSAIAEYRRINGGEEAWNSKKLFPTYSYVRRIFSMYLKNKKDYTTKNKILSHWQFSNPALTQRGEDDILK